MAMRAALFLIVTATAGCSQDPPPVLARAERGNLVFDVPSTGKPEGDCLTRIAVFVEDNADLAMPEPSDDREGVEDGLYWRAVGETEVQCIGSLPLRYDSTVKGSTIVRAKPLRAGTAYVVALREGSTRSLTGRFRIMPDKRVENLPKQQLIAPDAR